MGKKQKVRVVEIEDPFDDNSEQADKKENPAFNFAIDSLKNITEINRYLTYLSTAPVSDLCKQLAKIPAVKSLLKNAVPLAPKEFLLEYQTKILSITQKIKPRRTGYRNIQVLPMFSPELDLELDQHIIKINMALQRKGYFMPGKDESSMF
ncbi:hypothetical protein LCGC14_2780250 [marine sediment metagenome]|uniref:Uncharacterized protein n=1 Tax=marine sediment metagenome TaxID=412755 RepID=A0A0F8ZFK6_9ZZZZ